MICYRFTAESSPVTKKFENRSMFSKAMGKNRASCFRLTGYNSKQKYIQRECSDCEWFTSPDAFLYETAYTLYATDEHQQADKAEHDA